MALLPSPPPPDIALLAATWTARALLRAQLIEEGFDVAATDTWPMLRSYLRSEVTPRLVIVDLQGLDDPAGVLRDLRGLVAPSRVLIVTALATVAAPAIEQLGFAIVKRPIPMDSIVRTARTIIRSASTGD